MQASLDALILELDRAVRAPGVKRYVDAALERTRKALPQSNRAMTWEVVPLDVFKGLPSEIKSCWVFVLGPFQSSGAERHPNSHQRSLCLLGEPEYQTREGEWWKTRALRADADASVDDRWASIPQNVWHQWIVGPGEFAVLSFHTVDADDLVEERAADEDADTSGTTQRTYKEQERRAT
jgi:hypothetical protein